MERKPNGEYQMGKSIGDYRRRNPNGKKTTWRKPHGEHQRKKTKDKSKWKENQRRIPENIKWRKPNGEYQEENT